VLNRGSRVSLFICPVSFISLHRIQTHGISKFEEMLLPKPASIRILIVTNYNRVVAKAADGIGLEWNNREV
jgi:hypothetical protein